MRLRFQYTDNEGNKSTRTISDIIILSEFHLAAYCEMRDSGRTFNMNKMENILDLDKNIIVDDIQKHLGMIDEDGTLKEKYEVGREAPASIELQCKECSTCHEIDYFWALHHDRFTCECGKGYSITKEK
jgi:predicted DNA-binding transcriptional regulator YafY